MIDETVYPGKPFKETYLEMRKNSSYYPEIFLRYYRGFEVIKTNNTIKRLAYKIMGKDLETIKGKVICYASTLVRIERNGKWYAIPCMASVEMSDVQDERHLLLRIMDSAHRIQNLYTFSDETGDDPDTDELQISERERMIKNVEEKQR